MIMNLKKVIVICVLLFSTTWAVISNDNLRILDDDMHLHIQNKYFFHFLNTKCKLKIKKAKNYTKTMVGFSY